MLTDLIDRLREAKEGSRELDRDIAISTFQGSKDNAEYARQAVVSHGAKPHHFEVCGISGISLHTPEPVTTSLDAAVSLCERLFPGCEHGYYQYRHRPGDEYARATVAKIGGPYVEDVKARTPALALCLAVLLAKGEGE